MDGEKEKALFEAGIKLGAVFHQFIGVPIGPENVDMMEKAIESCVSLQPYVSDVRVKIDRERLSEDLSELGYTTLNEKHLNVEVKVEVGGSHIVAALKWDESLKYPLMKIEDE
ncbi:MAG: dihydroneopterin aldolase family protein [Halobacteriota archaeon]